MIAVGTADRRWMARNKDKAHPSDHDDVRGVPRTHKPDRDPRQRDRYPHGNTKAGCHMLQRSPWGSLRGCFPVERF
jgi:hypothetical protein